MCDYTVDTLLEVGRLRVMWADRNWHGGPRFLRTHGGLRYSIFWGRLEIDYSASEEQLLEWHRARYASSSKCG